MQNKDVTIKIKGKAIKVTLQFWDESDRAKLRKLYESWKILNSGMREYKARAVNLPEGISESAFCLDFDKDCGRLVRGPGSFDGYNIRENRMVQIKAVSVEVDLTSFGPKSIWDDLYFLDFYREGKFDGTFDVYKIPNDLIYTFKVNVTQTLKEQQAQGRRPRFSIKEGIIKATGLKPLKTCKI
jgi:hypothetical protein